MPMFGMFNIVLLAIGLLEIAVLGSCLIAFIVGCFMRSKVMIIGSIAIPAFLIAASCALSAMDSAQNPFPYLKEPPVAESIPGTYVLDPSSFEYLKSRGFTDLSATIVLHPDETFSVTRMPHIWADGAPESSGYDACSGTWTVGQDPTELTYNVTMMADKKVLPLGAVFFDLLAPKGKRKNYALAVPIFYGDFDYIYFVRKED